MADFVIKDPLEFNNTLRKSETTDPAHADAFNALFGQLINNDAFLAEKANNAMPRRMFQFNPVVGWNRAISFSSMSWVQFKVNVCRLWGNNPPETMSFVIGAAAHYNMKASIGQLNHDTEDALLIDKVRIAFDTTTKAYFFDIHVGCTGNPIQVEVFDFNDLGEVFFIGEEITDVPEQVQVLEYNTTKVGGIIANYAQYDMAGNDLAAVANACTGINITGPATGSTAKYLFEEYFKANDVNIEVYPNIRFVSNNKSYITNPPPKSIPSIYTLNSCGTEENPVNSIDLNESVEWELYSSHMAIGGGYSFYTIFKKLYESSITVETKLRSTTGVVINLNFIHGSKVTGLPNQNIIVIINGTVSMSTFTHVTIIGACFNIGTSTYNNCQINMSVPRNVSQISNYFNLVNCEGMIYCLDGIYDCKKQAPVE